MVHSITLATGESEVETNTVLGRLNYAAPGEAQADDARLIGASITAVAEGAFTTGANATKLVFSTGASETAVEKMSLSSAGILTLTGAIELGHASDTTLARASSGDLNVEGNLIYRAGGTDVPVADGGTGASSASAARASLGITYANIGTVDISANTNLAAGTGITLTGDSLSVDASQAQVTTVGTIGTGIWNGTPIASAYIADDAITGAKIALFDDSLLAASTHFLIADGADYSSFALSGHVTCTNDGVVSLAVNSVDSDQYVDGSIDTAHIDDAQVTLAKIASQAANTVLVRDASSSGVVSAKALTTTQILIGDGTGFTAAALSGDVTMTNAGAVTVVADAITYAKIQNVTDARMLGNNAGSDGVVAEMTKANVLSFLNVADGATASAGTVTSVAITGTDGIDVDSGSPITGAGTITLGLSSIANSALANSSVNYGGVTLSLGSSNTTPAFALANATGLPIVAGTTGTLTVARGGTGLTSIATLLNSNVTPTTLGLVIGTNVQAYDADLTALAGLSSSDSNFIVGSGSSWVAESGATARTSLGVDAAGTDNSTDVTLASVTGNYLSLTDQAITAGTVPVVLGGTGLTSLTDKAVLITQDSSTDAFTAVAMSSNGQLLIGGTNGPAVSTLAAGDNITITNADGTITIEASGGGSSRSVSGTTDNGIITWVNDGSTFVSEASLTYDDTNGLKVTSATSALPLLTIENTNADNTGGTLKFNKNGLSPLDSDVIGNIDFVSEDSASNPTTYARIQSVATDVSTTSEQGQIDFYVAETDGTLTKGMDIVGLGYDGAITVDISTHGSHANAGLKLGGTLITSTAAEINLLDGSASNTVVNSKAVIYGAAGQILGGSFLLKNSSAQTVMTLNNSGDNIVFDCADSIYFDAGAGQSIISAFNDTDLMTLTSGGVTVAGELDATTLDISGDADIAGTTALAGPLTVGVDDAGHDVTLYGEAAGTYLRWDESVNRLNLFGGCFRVEQMPPMNSGAEYNTTASSA